jgi:hypothetical protein
MKILVGLLALSFSLAGLASTGETKSFTFDGTQNTVELLLKGEKTHTEYKVEDVPWICYRNEVVGYQTVCTGGYGPYPRPYPYPYPRPYPAPYRQCYSQPIYRSVPYDCIRTVRTPFEVKDFDVDTKVTLNVANLSEVPASEKLSVTLLGDQLTLTMKGSKKLIGVLKTEAINPQMAGSVKIINAVYNVELVDAQAINDSLKLTKISMSRGVLSLKAGRIGDRGDLTLALNVVKKKALSSDVTLLDRALKVGEYAVEDDADVASNISIDMPALGLELNNGKYSITAKLSFNGRVLNRTELPELEVSRTLIYKN